MAKTTWVSKGDVWVFEDGQRAMFTPRGEQRQKPADFRVIEVQGPTRVLTDLRGYSSYGWEGPVVTFAGFATEYEPNESSDTGGETPAGDEA